MAKFRIRRNSWGNAPNPTKPNRALGFATAGPPRCLTPTKLKIIHNDSRWRSDAVQPWEDAPTSAEADTKAKAAAARLGHRNYATVAGASPLSLIIAACQNNAPCRSHACPRCGQVDQRWLVSAMKQVLAKKDYGFHDRAFNFVMPEGQTAISALADAPFDLILGAIRNALLTCPQVLFAVFAIDISANDDSQKFLLGERHGSRKVYFQAHVYGIVRTASRKAVWRALRPLFKKSASIFRPLWISDKRFDGSAYGISYVLKPHGVRHAPYQNKQGEWNLPRTPPPLKPREHVHYLLAMHQLGFSGRVGFVGLHPVVAKATKGKSTVVLRRVHREDSAQ